MKSMAHYCAWLCLPVAVCTSCNTTSHRSRVNLRDGLTYVWISPGSYLTGCAPDDGECMHRERTRQTIKIAKGFWVGRTEVTQTAYERVMATNPSRYPSPLHPVEQVDWQSARTYCSAVGMRLPTESEWEFAASGGINAPRYGPLDAIAWYDPNSDDSTHDVALKMPNPYGLFDMLGNVWEWVEDSSNVDPHRKIMKGGSFVNIASSLRVPERETPVEDLRHRNVGFRCVGN
jgi:formylglycine-generating enzyme required for sulfatase activity